MNTDIGPVTEAARPPSSPRVRPLFPRNQVCPSLQWGLDVGGSDGFSHPLHLVPAFRHPRKNVLSMLWGFIRGGRFR